MAEPKSENARQDDIPGLTTERGSLAGILAALTVLALVAVAAFWLIGTQRTVAAAPGMTIALETAKPANGGAIPAGRAPVGQ